MTLLDGKHNIGVNIRELIKAGHSPDQATAIAMEHASNTANVRKPNPDYAKMQNPKDKK